MKESDVTAAPVRSHRGWFTRDDWRALEHDWDTETFVAELAAQTERRRSSLAR